jgi:hypothetical protein
MKVKYRTLLNKQGKDYLIECLYKEIELQREENKKLKDTIMQLTYKRKKDKIIEQGEEKQWQN